MLEIKSRPFLRLVRIVECNPSPQREAHVMHLSDGEKLILMMLADLYKDLEVAGEIDANFISQAISANQAWAIKYKYGDYIALSRADDPPEVGETHDILDMWRLIEEGYAELSSDDKAKIDASDLGNVTFPGFDEQHEKHYFIARFMIEELGLYQRFKGRKLNSHHQVLDGYRRMYRVFEPIRVGLADRSMSTDEIVKLLSARMGRV
jgi:uncharacterized protein YfbU (UPF0304 family)